MELEPDVSSGNPTINTQLQGVLKKGASLPKKNPTQQSSIADELRGKHGWRSESLPTQVRAFNAKKKRAEFVAKGWLEEDFPDCEDVEVPIMDYTWKKMGTEVVVLDEEILKEVSIWDTIPKVPNGYTLYHPDDVMYGNKAMEVKKVANDTVPGYPWGVTKGYVTRKQLIGTKPGEAKVEFMDAIRLICESNADSDFYVPIYSLSLKIEEKPAAKVMIGATRAFQAGDVCFQIVGQCLFQGIVDAVKKRPTGYLAFMVSPHTGDWGHLGKRLDKHPNKIMTDASNWDYSQLKRMFEKLADELARHIMIQTIIDLSREFKLSRNLRNRLINTVMGCSCAWTAFLGILFMTYKNMKSGSFATTLFNCMLNALGWRYVFVHLAKKAKVDFDVSYMDAYGENVEDAFCGDDCVVSVSNFISSWFNQVTAAQAWWDCFKIVLTDAGKNTIEKLFTPVCDQNFLKRKWMWHRGYCTAPLPKQVIMEMCLWCKDPSFDARNVSGTCASACLEAAHHGEEFYNYIFGVLKAACSGRIGFKPLTFAACLKNIRA